MLERVDEEGEEQLAAERQAKRREAEHYKGMYLQFDPPNPLQPSTLDPRHTRTRTYSRRPLPSPTPASPQPH